MKNKNSIRGHLRFDLRKSAFEKGGKKTMKKRLGLRLGLGLAVVSCVLLSAVIFSPAQAEVDAIDYLKEMVEELNLPHGIETSLLAKLDSALASLERARDNAAANQLGAFINQVEAHSCKKIATDEADELIATAQEMLAVGLRNWVSWSCGDTIEDVDGNTYNTVQIGTQCWMQEHLNVGTMLTGTSDQTDNSTIEKYCYNDTASNCATYGGLYHWAEAMQYKDGCSNTISLQPSEPVQGICPSGWHVPSDAEWCTLEQAVDSSISSVHCGRTSWRGTDAGTKLKSGGTSGFDALYAGCRYAAGGTFNYQGAYAYIRSSGDAGLVNDINVSWYRTVWTKRPQVGRYAGAKTYGLSVRCLKD